MTTYPDDVMAAARKHCDLAGVTPRSDMRVYCEHVAASAIMTERQRQVRRPLHETGEKLASFQAGFDAFRNWAQTDDARKQMFVHAVMEHHRLAQEMTQPKFDDGKPE